MVEVEKVVSTSPVGRMVVATELGALVGRGSVTLGPLVVGVDWEVWLGRG